MIFLCRQTRQEYIVNHHGFLLLKVYLKWDIDASPNGKPRPSGIGGVLKDHKGKFFCIFSCSISIKESIKDEVLTIQKAFFFSLSCCYASSKDCIMESDSYNALLK